MVATIATHAVAAELLAEAEQILLLADSQIRGVSEINKLIDRIQSYRVEVPMPASTRTALANVEMLLIAKTERIDFDQPAEPSLLVGPGEVCRMLSISQTTLYRMGMSGQLPKPIKMIGRVKRWRRADIERWIENRKDKR